jgi:redox-sensing transcriptional repressor
MAGKPVAGIPVQHSDELEKIISDNGVSIGVIATPAGAAQPVCDRLVAAGVTSILNFAPTVLSVPEGVDVRKVDLSIELQILAFHEQRKAGEDAEAGSAAPAATAAARTMPAAAEAAGDPVAMAATEAVAVRDAADAAPGPAKAPGSNRKGPDGDVPAVMPA